MRRALRYFFPKRHLRTRLPLTSKRFKRDEDKQAPQDVRNVCRLLIAANVARNEADALRLLRQYPTLNYRQIIRRERRKRHFRPAWQTFAIRLKRFLIGCIIMLVMTLAMPSVASAQDESPIGTARVIVSALNVRAEPSALSKKLGVLRRGKTVNVYEVAQADDGGTWLRLRCPKQACWINGSDKYVRLNLAQDAPIVNRIERLTPELSVFSWTITPASPRPLQPFTVRITLQNKGAAASPFAIGVVTGEQFSLTTVNGLDAQAQGTIELEFIAPPYTGAHELTIALDLENTLDERDKLNNLVKAIYRVDAPLRSGTIQATSYANIDVDSNGTPDLAYNGMMLTPINGARIAPFDGKLTDLHFDALAFIESAAQAESSDDASAEPNAAESSESSASAPRLDVDVIAPKQGLIIAVFTAEGQRAWLRIANLNPLTLQYGVYDTLSQ